MKKLPIDEILSTLRQTICDSVNTVLVAPPGAGKTTRLPLALLGESWLTGKKILMLEPRRLAARAAARHMAVLLGEKVGETVGYRIRLDSCISSKTRIEVITEGILTRLLQNDPGLEDVGMVIFDEFHERSIHADLGLALCLQSQSVLREDLKILIMSATLDTAPSASLLGDAPVIISKGVSFPVTTHYIQRPITERIELAVVRKIQEAAIVEQGDILVFLPGAGEIHRVESQLLKIGMQKDAVITKLYGGLSQEEQDMAILPQALGKRKIVLATSIAQTSITLEGMRIVIDSGLMRIPRFSPRTGMMHLETVKVSRDVSDQRRGRAGRTEEGICYRLWTYEEELAHRDKSTPEIMEADLTSLVLELAAWGIQDPGELQWLDLPPEPAFLQARQLLFQLGALSCDGCITPHGQQLIKIGLHPRIAHMIFQGIRLGYGKLACEMAAVLSHRELFQGLSDADLRLRIEMVRKGSYHSIQTEIRYWKQVFAVTNGGIDSLEACGLLLAFAYPERVGQGRGDGRFLLRNGHGAAFKEPQLLATEPYLVAAELGGDQQGEKRIFLAAPVHLNMIKEHFKEQISVQDRIAWDHEVKAVRARRVEKLDALLLESMPLVNCDSEELLFALLQGIKEEGLHLLPWTKSACQFRQRLMFMHEIDPDWPNVSDDSLMTTLGEWLGSYLYGMSNCDHLQRLNLAAILGGMLSWEQGQKLNEWAPTHILVPSGQRIPIDYSDATVPVLAVRLQEMFGLKETPKIGQGKVAITLHLLSPAHRLVQVTKDIASFWENTYFQVKKDLMGRYPKHYWPDDPLKAMPTHRVRPRS
ncbi:ATP-dependent helicase HrpB [Pelosinus baikalensis]|uniref:ATP-dependent helicase HrpB n=1 Tax=Pelosinus baikalensis TaxID=2892015 RepID=A0ABS8HKW8_9FIRM|nr:ATP-dependent helicase HrpB [Pelosinus baikalensis]MCC5463830.1 ATP-dependent helicase HrpB [Pelosinus baikalensis]